MLPFSALRASVWLTKTWPSPVAASPYRSVPTPLTGLPDTGVSVAVSKTKTSRSGTSGSITMFVSEPGMFGLSITKSARSPVPIVHWTGSEPGGGPPFPGSFGSGHVESSDWLKDSKAATKSQVASGV
jgi:hypothetical protein